MKHTAIVIAAGLAFAATLPPTSAQAQNGRSFVSGHGLDANACTLAAPCRTFAVALTHTNAGGEIDVLDTAGYGQVTIDRAISIVNDGSVASILVPPDDLGITINAGATDAVTLRGLTIEGSGVGNVGIEFNSGQSLTIENSVIRNFTNSGIIFGPNASSNLSVSNTLANDNVLDGIALLGTAPNITATFNRVEANNNGTGILVAGLGSNAITVTVSDSVLAHNSGSGIVSQIATVTLVRSVVANNGKGLNAVNGTFRVAQSTVTGNTSGWVTIGSGVVLSAGDNTIEGNGSNETAPTAYAKK
jgi:hypothetical protein